MSAALTPAGLHARASQVPDRKEREEIEGLKGELAQAKKDLAVREARWKTSVERLRKSLTEVQGERDELQREVQLAPRASNPPRPS